MGGERFEEAVQSVCEMAGKTPHARKHPPSSDRREQQGLRRVAVYCKLLGVGDTGLEPVTSTV